MRYEFDESTDVAFSVATTTTQSVTVPRIHVVHIVTQPTAFYYRVRAIFSCGPGAYSVTVHVVLAPLTAPENPNVSVPVGNFGLVPIHVHVPGLPNQTETFHFTATVDKPWLAGVTPTSGDFRQAA